MAKAKTKDEPFNVGDILKRKMHSIHPWEVQHHPDFSEIEAYSELTGDWEIIAVIKTINHVAIATWISALANEYNRGRL